MLANFLGFWWTNSIKYLINQPKLSKMNVLTWKCDEYDKMGKLKQYDSTTMVMKIKLVGYDQNVNQIIHLDTGEST